MITKIGMDLFQALMAALKHQTEQGVNIPTTQGSDTSAPADFIINYRDRGFYKTTTSKQSVGVDIIYRLRLHDWIGFASTIVAL